MAVGVPLSEAERNGLSQNYLQRKMQSVRQINGDMDYDEIERAAKQSIVTDLDQFLHQIAARSQTLLAVIALVIGIFVAISEQNGAIRKICVLWALMSLSLFYNIWIFYGSVDSYATPELEYNQTTRLAYRRSIVFNANVGVSIVTALLCAVIYFLQ